MRQIGSRTIALVLALTATAAVAVLTAGGLGPEAAAGGDTPRPTEGWTLHITAKMHFPGKPEMLAHHFCKQVAGGLIECQLYDSAAPDAHLVGVETIVNAATYAKFSPAEKAQWHYHRVEIPLVSAAVLDMSPDEAAKVVNSIVDTYGKIYLLWDPSVQGQPTGRPSITVLRAAKAP
ncbi:MAG TPA: DUF1264 domain-containing protein [bacterium]|nr:DUF1264 domain-containing protein [bacterium]